MHGRLLHSSAHLYGLYVMVHNIKVLVLSGKCKDFNRKQLIQLHCWLRAIHILNYLSYYSLLSMQQ